MDLFTLFGDDFHISSNGVTQVGDEALWDAASHTNRLQHNLLEEMLGQGFFGMNFGILGMTLDMVFSTLLDEFHEYGPVDLANHGGLDRADDNTLGGELIHQIFVSCTGIW